MPGPPTQPTLPEDINSALLAMVGGFPNNVELITLPSKSADAGKDIQCVRLHDGNAPKDPAVLIMGGIHAREWAPPDALLRLAQDVLNAFKNDKDIVFPALTAQYDGSPGGSVDYPSFTIPVDSVKKIFEHLDLYILPCVNPDGRVYDITNPGVPFGPGWRRNRRKNPDNPDPKAVGVDLNRNFDIAWDFGRFYDMSLYRLKYSAGPSATEDTDDTFNGVTDQTRTVTVAGGATGGTYILSFNGADSAPIAFGAKAADVQAALTALATIGAGNVTVTGPDGGPYQVKFTAARDHPVAMLTATWTLPATWTGTLTGGPGSRPHIEIVHASPTTEAETLNVQWLMDTRKIRYFLDIHQAGRSVMFPWGLEDNDGDDTMTFQKANWDFKRDGLLPGDVPAGVTNYNEFMPSKDDLGKKVAEIAGAMSSAILAAAGADPKAAKGTDPRKDHSLYEPGQLSRYYHKSGVGPLTANSADYIFSRQFTDPTRAPVYALAMEVGHAEEGGFHPDYTSPKNQYQKIEREVYAACIAFCMAAVRGCHLCLIATAAYDDHRHPDVEFLRDLRDRVRQSSERAARIVAVLERVYYSFSPAVARFLIGRRRCRAVVRHAVVRPLVLSLKVLTRMWGRCRDG